MGAAPNECLFASLLGAELLACLARRLFSGEAAPGLGPAPELPFWAPER